ncbi:MAG: hypothetical protein K6T33_06825 [Thermomonas hydrothermalis]|uniref:DUF7210 family protein n=1 Tax=Thermomonas hydrothermalis TaxID=213588 RepID=UPI002355665B|nr:hypothetical protein [Thermomonas hydrothermalis]MCL6619489.1 hypothetical protein [Thermomonas hydrothermalis]
MRIDLLKPHIHLGQVFTPGETLDLPDDTARWLIDAGVARAVEPAPKPDKPTRKESSHGH